MQIGVTTAIFDEQGRVLLTQREDFEVWCMPGGSVDEGESLAQAATREAFEETGLRVQLTSHVATYSYEAVSDGMLHITCYRAVVIGGSLQPDPHEVIAMEWFAPDALPEHLLVGQRRRILDAASGVVGKVQREQRTNHLPHRMSRKEVYAFRDASGLSRREFYTRYFPELREEDVVVEVVGSKPDF
jgi:8-oxo-dGTP pyrophosphatase MutT (NUDIX family)